MTVANLISALTHYPMDLIVYTENNTLVTKVIETTANEGSIIISTEIDESITIPVFTTQDILSKLDHIESALNPDAIFYHNIIRDLRLVALAKENN